LADLPPQRMPSRAEPARAPDGGDWPATVADTIVRFVDQAKSKTTRPVVVVVRAAVYGLVAGLLGLVVAVLAFIGIFRAVDRLRDVIVADSVWLTYLVLGLVFTVVGAIVFSTRTPRS
jgi:hypothetical protein